VALVSAADVSCHVQHVSQQGTIEVRTKRDHGIDVERMRAFDDAVFAIAITLLALDMKVPEGLPSSELGHALSEALPSIGGYLLSFVVIGLVWISHHRLFSLVRKLDHTLLYLCLALLAVVAGLPFPTKLISGYGKSAVATSVYAGSIAVAALLLTGVAVHLLRQPALLRPDVQRAWVLQSLWQALAFFAVFATSVPVSLISSNAAQYWWLLVVPMPWLTRRIALREQLPLDEKPSGQDQDSERAPVTGA
jgi:uncharacterized membrane protein